MDAELLKPESGTALSVSTYLPNKMKKDKFNENYMDINSAADQIKRLV